MTVGWPFSSEISSIIETAFPALKASTPPATLSRAAPLLNSIPPNFPALKFSVSARADRIRALFEPEQSDDGQPAGLAF
jgi:hypothetical protein